MQSLNLGLQSLNHSDLSLKIKMALKCISAAVEGIPQTLNLGRYAASRNHLPRASLGHIGDVHVGYQVDINVETAQTEPGNV
jgi:hypothetical protein